MSEYQVWQLSVGGFDNNFSYIVRSNINGDVAVIDPCGDIALLQKTLFSIPSFKPRYILVTHGHHDHISGMTEVKTFFAAPVAAHPKNSCGKDISVQDRQQLQFGSGFIEALFTPGHTADGITWHLSDDSAIFTGDTLFVDWIGYCDAKTMFHSLRNIIMPLADSNVIYSGHDYGREPFSMLGVEKTRNPYLSAADFTAFNEALKSL